MMRPSEERADEATSIAERIEQAKLALDQMPANTDENKRQKITELIINLMIYSHSLNGRWRNMANTGQILAEVTAVTAEIGRASNSSRWDYQAPGYVEEAAWLVGELMAEADARTEATSARPPALKLLALALLNYQANRPRHEYLAYDEFPEPWDTANELRVLLGELQQVLSKVVTAHPEAVIEVLSEALGAYTER
ncbi:hypothetical protein [Nonomuraea sp. NPDC049695]|uniref:hypothetical protein n=1 Tax=Nonomuraea sp. NPDC049695 TaxID=3154734 RepID=UPI0034335D35